MSPRTVWSLPRRVQGTRLIHRSERYTHICAIARTKRGPLDLKRADHMDYFLGNVWSTPELIVWGRKALRVMGWASCSIRSRSADSTAHSYSQLFVKDTHHANTGRSSVLDIGLRPTAGEGLKLSNYVT